MNEEEKFSDNEEENLRINNELLRLQLTAQYGNTFRMESAKELPPELENQFLKNIMAFEEHFQHGNKTVPVYEKIGKPAFTEFSLLDKEVIEDEINRLLTLLAQHGIKLSFIHGLYDNEVIYRFITEEFFQVQTDTIDLPGMTSCYIYENYHINNKAEIEENTNQFFADWEERNFSELSIELEYGFVSEKLTKEEIYSKIKMFCDCFREFRNAEYTIGHIQVDEQPDGTAMGFSEGIYRYEAVLENGESMLFDGPFKLYMRRADFYWEIFHIIIPGFEL